MLRASPGQLGQLESRASLDLLEAPGRLAERETQERPDLLVQLEASATKDRQAQQGFWVPWVRQGGQAQQDRLDQPDLPVQLAHQDQLDLRVQ